jgi:hypothetical protein
MEGNSKHGVRANVGGQSFTIASYFGDCKKKAELESLTLAQMSPTR